MDPRFELTDEESTHAGFQRVVIKQGWPEQQHNIHLAVHPFSFGRIRMMNYKGDEGIFDEPLLPWQQAIADALWDSIPGLARLFFTNGAITIQHNGAFADAEIVATATEILRPALEEELQLSGLL